MTHGGYFYSAGGLTGGSLAQVKRNGDVFEVTPVYFSRRLPIGVGGSLLGALLAGSGVLTLWLLVTGHAWAPLLPALPWLVLSGVLSYAMLGLLYAALQRGPISIATGLV